MKYLSVLFCFTNRSTVFIITDIVYVYVITLTGMEIVEVAPIICELCGWRLLSTTAGWAQIALWPLNGYGDIFIEFKFLFFVSTLQKMSPILSSQSILQSLDFITTITGHVSIFILNLWPTNMYMKHHVYLKLDFNCKFL